MDDLESGPTLPAETAIGTVALSVADLERQISFYRDVVGLTLVDHGEQRVTLGADDTQRPLLQLRKDRETPERGSNETGLFHVAFRVPSRAALGDALERVRTEWSLEGAADHLASEALYLVDPEGNGIEVYADRPADEWVRDGDEVLLETLPLELAELESLSRGQETVPAGTTVGHVHLEVSSIDVARTFYVDGLGMNVRFSPNQSALFVAAAEYHHHVGLNTWNTRTEPAQGRGLEWVELLVPDRGTLEGIRQRFDEQGVEGRELEGAIAVSDPDEIEWRIRVDDDPAASGR